MTKRDLSDLAGQSRDRHIHYVDIDVGTGSKTIFQMSQQPLDAKQVQVFVDGRLLNPSALGVTNDYSMNPLGSSVILAVAPPAGKVVQLHYAAE